MATDTHTTDRVTHILALMKQGDDAFNRRDKAAMDAAHHPEMVAHITGNAEPIHGRDAHAAAMGAIFGAFPMSTSRTIPTRSSSVRATG